MFRAIAHFLKRITLLAAVSVGVVGYLATGLDERVGGIDRGRWTKPADGIESASLSDVTVAVSSATEPPQLPAASVRQPDDPSVEQAIDDLDAAFSAIWTEKGVEVASEADWLTISRRLSLALVGSGLPLEEIRVLQSLPAQQRLQYQIGRLLRDPRHHDYWAERWTRTVVGASEGPFITYRRRRFRLWLSDAIATNRRIDVLVRQMVTGRGLPTDRPEVNFLTVTMDSDEQGQPDPIRLAARTSRAFLGLRIDCLQCHDDFLGNASLGEKGELREGTQQDFHSLAAFYSSARFNGLQGIRDVQHPYDYQFLDTDEAVTVEPAVPFNKHLLPTEGDARQRLAVWLTHPENDQFSYAIVNRVWALMFGRALTDAVDDLRLDQPPHPAVKVLAEELVSSGYDLRHLIRVIAGSRAFQLSSEADFEITPAHEANWSVFPLARLRPEQVAASVIQAARVKTVDRDSSLVVQLQKFGGMNDFVTRYGDIGEDEFEQESVTITQRLLMLNGELVREHGESNPLLNSTSHINMFSRSDAEAIENIYLCVLNRLPDPEEAAIYSDRLQGSVSDSQDPKARLRQVARQKVVGLTNPQARRPREKFLEDMFWVLTNSSEFSWNH
ncbi:MAG TPA: hypothetical protein DDZ51_08470 [Planctomycetaceae bacterium]|nr:hypothetical protein [Planctomycetaceae bacterium]